MPVSIIPASSSSASSCTSNTAEISKTPQGNNVKAENRSRVALRKTQKAKNRCFTSAHT